MIRLSLLLFCKHLNSMFSVSTELFMQVIMYLLCLNEVFAMTVEISQLPEMTLAE